MEEMLMQVIDWAVPFLCGGALTGVTAYWKGRKKRESALEIGVQCLLRAEILRCKVYGEKMVSRLRKGSTQAGIQRISCVRGK